MKKFLIGAIAASVIAAPAFAALKNGDKAPDFAAKASLAGEEFNFSLKDALKKGPVVVYFYPAAYTGGCNIEAHTFAENKEKFDAAGATIIGVSRDTIAQLNDFSSDPAYCAGKFPVAADPDGKISDSYDLKILTIPGATGKFKDTRGQEIDHAFTERTTFVITPDYKVIATLSSSDDKISPADHAEKSLVVVQGLKKK